MLIRRIHAEAEDEGTTYTAIGDVAWSARWPSGAVTWHVDAHALVRTVLRRDRCDAARPESGCGAVVSVITWHAAPAGFVPPTAEQA